MLNFTYRFLAGLALFALASVATAQTDAATAEMLMRKSGLWQQLADVAPQFRAGIQDAFSQTGAKTSASEQQRLSKIVDKAYEANRLRGMARDAIAKGTNASHVPALNAWFASPLGAAITKAEEVASADQRDPAQVAQEGAAAFAALPQARRRLIEQLVAASRAGEAMATMTINGAIAVQAGVALANPGAPAPSTADFRKMMEVQRPQMEAALTKHALGIFATMYAPLNDDQLGKYVKFLNSAAGRHFTDVCTKAVDAALTDAARSFGQSLPGTKDGSNT